MFDLGYDPLGFDGISLEQAIYMQQLRDGVVYGFTAAPGAILSFPHRLLGKIRNLNIGITTSRNCELSIENKKDIRNQMKENEKLAENNKKNITIKFSYFCNSSTGKTEVEKYRDSMRTIIKKNKEVEEAGNKLEFNPTTLEYNELVAPDTLETGWEYVKKYNKIGGSNITKIRVFINDNEYKEVPYLGPISDEYHKILFSSSFDIFPTKQLNKIKN